MRLELQGRRTHCVTRETKDVRLVVEDYWSASLDSWWIRIVEGGVTGYESCSVYAILEDARNSPHRGWYACAGTKDKWDVLYISPPEMEKLECALRKEYIHHESVTWCG